VLLALGLGGEELLLELKLREGGGVLELQAAMGGGERLQGTGVQRVRAPRRLQGGLRERAAAARPSTPAASPAPPRERRRGIAVAGRVRLRDVRVRGVEVLDHVLQAGAGTQAGELVRVQIVKRPGQRRDRLRVGLHVVGVHAVPWRLCVDGAGVGRGGGGFGDADAVADAVVDADADAVAVAVAVVVLRLEERPRANSAAASAPVTTAVAVSPAEARCCLRGALRGGARGGGWRRRDRVLLEGPRVGRGRGEEGLLRLAKNTIFGGLASVFG
jgi:hypothetical protein